MKHSVLLYTERKDLINNLMSIEALNFQYSIVNDASDLFDFDKNKECMILFDLDSFKEDFKEFFEYLKKDLPLLKIMLLRSKLDLLEGVEFLKDGVKGYGNSFMQPVHLEQAIDVICEGNIWIYPELALYMIQQTPVNSSDIDILKQMDEREKEIIKFVCRGMRNKEIADNLSLSEISVKKLLTLIYRKLHVKDRIEMIAHFNR